MWQCVSLWRVFKVLSLPTDPGLQRLRTGLLLRQRLCGLFQPGDLDGAAEQPAHGAGADLRPAHDHAAPHHGPLRRPQGPRHLGAPDRVISPPCLPVPWRPFPVLPVHSLFIPR